MIKKYDVWNDSTYQCRMSQTGILYTSRWVAIGSLHPKPLLAFAYVNVYYQYQSNIHTQSYFRKIPRSCGLDTVTLEKS